jgi:hypothetical protein
MKKSCKIESFSQVKSSSTTPMHSRIGKSRDSVNPPVVISETKEHLNSPETSYLGYEMVHSFAWEKGKSQIKNKIKNTEKEEIEKEK